jgi:GNAT superfamily N-acetyltransferase
MLEIVELTAEEAIARIGELADILLDAVRDGASVGFMSDISRAEAEAFWRETIAAIAAGTIIFAVAQNSALVGCVLLQPCRKPNQPHRADVAKLLVLARARRGGIASRLMDALEARSRALGRTLLTLDTATGSDAENFYVRRGYGRAGVIPGYALMPDGAPTGTTFYYKQLA